MKQLTPQEALNVLENAVKQIQTNFDTHAVFQQAVQVLRGVLPVDVEQVEIKPNETK